MRGIFNLKPRRLVPGLILGLALTLSLPEGNISASRRDKAGQKYDALTEGHRGLVNLFRSRQTRLDQRTVKVRRPGAVRLSRESKTPVPPQSEPKRVYLKASQEDAALLARSMAQGLRRLSPDQDHLPLLAELNRLAKKSKQGSASLASAGDELPEPTVKEIEPNDNRESAQKIAYGDIVAATSVPDRDLDIFSFEAGAGDYVRIEVLPENDGWVAALLFDADSNLVSGGNYGLMEDAISPVDSRDFAPVWMGGNVIGATLKAGAYFIAVQSYPGGIRYLDDVKTLDDAGIAEEKEVSYRLTLTNPPTYPLSGRVIDDADHPVEGALLFIWPHDGTGGARVAADKDGAFALNLPEGSYSVTVEGPAGSRYPPNQLREQFRIGPGGTELQFVLRSGVIFSGRTVDDRGSPVPHLGFSLIDRDNSQYRWGNADEEGNFSVALFPGTYDIYLHASWKYPSQPVIRKVEIQEDTEYTIRVDTGNRISGRVLDPEESPVAGVGLSFFGRMDSRYARTDEQGFYEVALSNGSYNVRADLPMDILLPSQEVGTITVESDMEFDIRLAAGGIISGTVIDSRGNPVEGAGINLWLDRNSVSPDPRETGEDKPRDEGTGSDDADSGFAPEPYYKPYAYHWLNTDSQGRWQAALMPGSYAVEVVAPWSYPDQRLKAGMFEVLDGQTVEVPAVTIEHGVLFSGRILLPDGSPMERGYFQVTTCLEEVTLLEPGIDVAPEPMPPVYPWYSFLVPVGEGGSFKVRLLPGTYCLGFDGVPGPDGYPFQRVDSLRLENDLEMDITLDAGLLISGRVVDPDKTGIEGCWLNFFTENGIWRGASTVSGSDGSFSTRLVAGDYYLAVQPVKGYFPDSLVQSLSLTMDTSLEIVLRPGVRVFGRVTDVNGRPLPWVTVHLVPHTVDDTKPVDDFVEGEPAAGDSVVSDEELLAAVLAAAVGLVEEEIPEPLKAGYDTENISGEGIDQGAANYAPFGGPEPMSPVGPDADIWRKGWPYWGWDAVAWTDVDGYFETRVRAGVYDLYAWPPEPGYASVQLPGLDCTTELEVNLTLETADVKVDGKVEDPAGTTADSVLVSAYDESTGNHQAVYTDESGSFELQLAAGVYQVFVDGTDKYGEAEVIQSLKLDSDRSLRLRLGTGLLDENDGTAGSAAHLPRAYSLAQNSPNPFNPSTTISYTLAEAGQVSLAVYDLRGRLVKTLAEGLVDAGTHHVQWNGTDSRGRVLASGVYFYRLKAESYSQVRKMVLLK